MELKQNLQKTDLVYLRDAYLTESKARILDIQRKGNLYEVILNQTIFCPEGGGQSSDTGKIIGQKGIAKVKYVHFVKGIVVHQCSLEGEIGINEEVSCQLDWNARYRSMKRHTAGHIIHNVIMQFGSDLKPIKWSHAKKSFMQYQGKLDDGDLQQKIEDNTNKICRANLDVKSEFIRHDELAKKCDFVPDNLPKDKPLRIILIGNFKAVPCGGTHIKNTGEIEKIRITGVQIDNYSIKINYKI